MGEFAVRFPCGMQIESNSYHSYFGDSDLEKIYNEGCPIHGKNCNNKSSVRRK